MRQVIKYILAFWLCWASSSWAFSSFEIGSIKLVGLRGIAPSTVFNYLPMKEGDTLTEESSSEAIRALFKTGFFNDVSLQRDGNVLIIKLQERPAIARVKITGNDEIGEEDLTSALKRTGLSEGRIFNRSLLEN